jgi:hypothetical protein
VTYPPIVHDSPDIDRLQASPTSSEVRSRIYTAGARAWPEVSRFLADGRQDWLERVAIAEQFIDLYGDDAMVDRMIQAADLNATIAESIADAHLGDMSGTGVDRLSDWQFTYHLARDERLDIESDQAPAP